MSLVIRDPIRRPATSSTRREGMLEAEARFSIIIVTVDRSSILISVNGLLKSDFLFASHLSPLLFIWRHIILNIVLRCSHAPFLSNWPVGSWRKSDIPRRKCSIWRDHVVSLFIIAWRGTSEQATWSYHVIKAIKFWSRLFIGSKLRKIGTFLIADHLETFSCISTLLLSSSSMFLLPHIPFRSLNIIEVYALTP